MEKYIWRIAILIGVVFLIVINLKFFFDSTSSLASNTVTVLIHGDKGKGHKVLPNRGIVKLIYGDAIVPKQINNQCEATFTQINDAFFKLNTGVEIIFEDPQGEPYENTIKDTLYKLTRGKYIPVEVKLFGLDKIIGIVKSEMGEIIKGAIVRVQGIETISNEYGEYIINIPKGKQQKFQTIRAYHNDFDDFELEVPIQTGREIPVLLKYKK